MFKTEKKLEALHVIGFAMKQEMNILAKAFAGKGSQSFVSIL